MVSDETKDKKPKAGKKGLVYWRPNSTLVIGDRTYEHGDSCDDMSADEQKKYAASIRKAEK